MGFEQQAVLHDDNSLDIAMGNETHANAQPRQLYASFGRHGAPEASRAPQETATEAARFMPPFYQGGPEVHFQ